MKLLHAKRCYWYKSSIIFYLAWQPRLNCLIEPIHDTKLLHLSFVALASISLVSCGSEESVASESLTEDPKDEQLALVGKVQSHSGNTYNIQGVMKVRGGNVIAREVGKAATGIAWDDFVTQQRKGELIRPSDVFYKGFKRTNGKYPYLYWSCHNDVWGWRAGSIIKSMSSEKNRTTMVWRADGKSAARLLWQRAPHKWTGVNKDGSFSGQDEWGIKSVNENLKGDAYYGQAGVKAFWKNMENSKTIELMYVNPGKKESTYARWDLPKTLQELKPEFDKACKTLGTDYVGLSAR